MDPPCEDDIQYVWNTVKEDDMPVIVSKQSEDDEPEDDSGWDVEQLCMLGEVLPGYEKQLHTFDWYMAALGDNIGWCKRQLEEGLPDTGFGSTIETHTYILNNLQTLLDYCAKKGIMKKIAVGKTVVIKP